MTEGNNKLTIKQTPLSHWENSREYAAIGNVIAKNRKLIREQFDKISKSTCVNFEQAKQAMESFFLQHFGGISDDKLKTILRVAELQGANPDGIGNQYDYVRMLDVYKTRHAAPLI